MKRGNEAEQLKLDFLVRGLKWLPTAGKVCKFSSCSFARFEKDRRREEEEGGREGGDGVETRKAFNDWGPAEHIGYSNQHRFLQKALLNPVSIILSQTLRPNISRRPWNCDEFEKCHAESKGKFKRIIPCFLMSRTWTLVILFQLDTLSLYLSLPLWGRAGSWGNFFFFFFITGSIHPVNEQLR